MSNAQPVYTFLPWVRQGIAASLPNDAADLDRATVTVALEINQSNQRVEVPIALYSPGDITGIDPRQVVRTEPRHLTMDFEPNYLAAIEFDRPDFPWLFSPSGADKAGHLQPWLCLVVVEKQDGVTLSAEPGQPLPVLAIAAPANAAQELPNLTEAWVWAHSQVCWTPDATSGDAFQRSLEAELKQNSVRSVSRLLCPRQLKPNTQYYACLVPTFEAGRQAGLGDSVTANADALAWQPTSQDLQLPVYYHWEFGTSAAGDFESLLQRLQVRKLPPQVGQLQMTVPGLTPEMPSQTIALEGALRPVNTPPIPGVDPTFKETLKAILNAQSTPTETDPIVAPPIYGRMQMGQVALKGSPTAVSWLRDLNLHPVHRVAAGLGAQVIRNQQEPLMAAAWEQAGQIQQINQTLLRGQLAREVGLAVGYKHLSKMAVNRFVQFAAPAHLPMQAKGTLQTQLRQITGPDATTSAAFRRLVRPRGAIARQFLPTGEVRAKSMLRQSFFHSTSPQLPAGIETLPFALQPPAQTASNFLPVRWGAPAAGSGTPTPEASKFQQAIATHLASRAVAPPAQPKAAAVELQATKPSAQMMKQATMKLLNPTSTVLKHVQQQIEAPDTLWQRSDPLAPIAVTPQFSQPMYEALRDLFQDMLLPGLGDIPPNTIALLETNPQFIEAFLVGLNHEMGRELLWREFPADLRGTYFRRFWDRRSADEQTLLPDVPPIQDWKNGLGGNLQGNPDGQLLLLIRGDLLRRYPTATIYAVEAVWQTETQRTLGKKEFYPLFQGRWNPDGTFLGFSLTEAQAKGATTRSQGHPGYFFVIQEQPSEPRFGLDVADQPGGTPNHWRNLSWGNLVNDSDALTALQQVTHIPIQTRNARLNTLQLNGLQWGADAAHMASITLQKPVRIAIHASTWLTQS